LPIIKASRRAAFESADDEITLLNDFIGCVVKNSPSGEMTKPEPTLAPRHFPVLILMFEKYLNGLCPDAGPGEISTARFKLVGTRNDFARNQ